MPTPNSTPSNPQTGSQYLSSHSLNHNHSSPHAHIRRSIHPSSSSPAKKPTSSASQQPPASQVATPGPRPATNIWQLMGYPIPRGPCRHKPSMLSSSCACLRFMLNPVVAGSTFCCDGCGHHASYHVLKGEYPLGDGGGDGGDGQREGMDGVSPMVGMGVGEIIQAQSQNTHGHHGHTHGQILSGGTPGKGRGKRVIELEFDDDHDDDHDGSGDVNDKRGGMDTEWGDDVGELMIVSRGGGGINGKGAASTSSHGSSSSRRRLIPGSFDTNGHKSGNETPPAAKRSRV